MRRTILLASVLCTLAAVAAPANYPETLKIDAAAKIQLPVPFSHAKHGELAKSCDTCHHTQKGLTREQVDKVDVKKCSECHLQPQEKIGTMAEISMTRNPMHVRCIGCHKEQKKGPTGICGQCHRKQ